MALAEYVDLVTAIHAVVVAVAGRHTHLFKGGADYLVVIYCGKPASRCKDIGTGAPKLIGGISVDSHRKIWGVVRFFCGDSKNIIGKTEGLVVPVLVASREGGVPCAGGMEGIPEAREHIVDLASVACCLIASAKHLIEASGRVNGIKREYEPEGVHSGGEIIGGVFRDHLKGACGSLVASLVIGVGALCGKTYGERVKTLTEDVDGVHHMRASVVEGVLAGVFCTSLFDDAADSLCAEVYEPAEVGVCVSAPSAAPACAYLTCAATDVG